MVPTSIKKSSILFIPRTLQKMNFLKATHENITIRYPFVSKKEWGGKRKLNEFPLIECQIQFSFISNHNTAK